MPQSPLLKINDEITVNVFQIATMRYKPGAGQPANTAQLSIVMASNNEVVRLTGDEATRVHDFLNQHAETLPEPAATPGSPVQSASDRFADLVNQEPGAPQEP